MNFRSSRRSTYLESFNFSSLTDVVMQLLIFFLLTFSFANTRGMDVILPKAESSQVPQRKTITVSINRGKAMYLNNQQVTRQQLASRLASLLGTDRDQQVVVRADKNTPIQDVVEVFDIAKGAGATRLFIATESDTRPQ